MSSSLLTEPIPKASEALQAFAKRRLQPSVLLELLLRRIDLFDAELGAYLGVERQAAERAVRQADLAWQRGRPGSLAGLPLSIKDLIDVRGVTTSCGNVRRTPQPAKADAQLIQRLRAAGAVILGKVRLHEYALGITGENDAQGTPKNPHDPSRLPGGSSSGSAVSVAAGMAVASIGTDTGGSSRVPAAFCGVVGFKPSFGRIGRGGVFPLSWSMDHVGVIARSVADVRLIAAALYGEDPADPASRRLPPDPEQRRPLRAGLLTELVRRADPAVERAVVATCQALNQSGVAVEEVALEGLADVGQAYSTILCCEAAAVHHQLLASDPEHFSQEVRAHLEAGQATPAPSYVLACRQREAFASSCERVLAQVDCLILPTTLVTAPPRGTHEVTLPEGTVPLREALLSCTSPFSLVGLPALSVPCGQDDQGLPIGLQIVGPRYCESLVLALGELVERLVS